MDYLRLEKGPGGPMRMASPASRTSEPWVEPELAGEVIQVLCLSPGRGGPGLRYQVLQDPVVTTGKGGLVLGPGARVSFDAFLNSFYEQPWSRHAPLGRIVLRLYGAGQVLLQWYWSRGGDPVASGEAPVALDLVEGALVHIPRGEGLAGVGRLFFILACPWGTAVLRGGRYETNTSPRREVSLGIGICTFNREDALAANLRRIVESPYYRWARPSIAVVNQGAPFQTQAMAALLAREPVIRVFEQPNLGGAGGFTRAAMELVQDGRSTHVLFMDDDIDVDPAVLVPTHAFAAWAICPTVVGGAMLDLLRPATMCEAGSAISRENILRPAHRGLALDGGPGLDVLAEETPVHFNGWWYCAIPTEAFLRHGLPLPVFIRGDDMEYGARLAAKGIMTVPLPPVSVWHEPFYAKPPGWQLYYDLRNRLIFASCHPDQASLDSPLVLLRRLADCLVKHDYMHAELLMRAVGDFLAGPDVLERPADTIHGEIVALAYLHAPRHLDGAACPAKAASTPRKPRWTALGVLRVLAGLWRGVPRQSGDGFTTLDVESWRWFEAKGLPRYLLTDSRGSFIRLYEYDQGRFRQTARRGAHAILRYAFSSRPSSRAWRARHARLSGWAWWQDRFAAAHAPPSPPGPFPRQPDASTHPKN
jgi:galactofuranosylgalactofuranosylrhamnosyl-N-acetylglucosaminyl-diphospho-decaprenol beta-1,5/1,6-galactofuranosyltransferase